AEDFMKGVAFLHRHYVAHRDIKPDNLVCCADTFRLELIDFECAIQVWDEYDEVDEEVGTDMYRAPETKECGRPQPYSPIFADRWSCGCVL
ncbi:kinase-like protein, partial [Fistulina hepatica ATCC 64428]